MKWVGFILTNNTTTWNNAVLLIPNLKLQDVKRNSEKRSCQMRNSSPWQNDFVFSEHMAKLTYAMHFICLKNIHVRTFFSYENVHTRVNLRSNKIRKIPSLVDFYSLYILLHSQVERNDLRLWISNVKICIDKWSRIK